MTTTLFEKSTTKLYQFTSAKTLQCDICNEQILPLVSSFEGENEGTYHFACALQKYMYTSHVIGYMPINPMNCNHCNEQIEMLGAFNFADCKMYHVDCVEKVAYSEQDYTELHKKRTQEWAANPVKVKKEATPEYTEEVVKKGHGNADIPDGKYIVNGICLKVETSQYGNLSGKVILSLLDEPQEKKGTGFAFVDGNKVKVWSKQKGKNIQAEKAAHQLFNSDSPIDYAIAFGKQTGICAVCSAKLTNAASVERGIGPICAEKF